MSTPAYTSFSGFSGKTLNLSPSQAVSVPSLRASWTRTPSATTPSWGGTFVIDYKPPSGIKITDAVVEFYVAALSGLTVTNSGTAALSPTFFWSSKIEILLNGVVLTTVYPASAFARNQLFAGFEEDRQYINNTSGDFNSHTSRATKSASAGYWYLPLGKTPLGQSGLKFINGNTTLQLRFTLDSLSNLYSLTSGSTASGTAAAAISSATLLTREERLTDAQLSYETQIARKAPIHYLYTSTLWQSNTIPASTTATTITLNNITGVVSHLIFMLRAGSSLSGSSYYTFSSELSTYDILDQTSSSIVGGQPILSNFGTQILPIRQGARTLFFNTVTSGVYLYSFAHDAGEHDSTARHLGSRIFSGSEQLKLVFSSATAAVLQCDIFAYQPYALETSGGAVKTFAVHA